MMESITDKKRYNKGWDNLRPIKKGEVRNPNGRPKKADCLLECIKEELAKVSPNGQTNEQLTAAVLVAMGTRGNLEAIKLEMLYLHARPAQGIDLSGRLATDINFVIGRGYDDKSDISAGK